MSCNSISSSLPKQTPHLPKGLCSGSSWKESLPAWRQKSKPSESGLDAGKKKKKPNTPLTKTAWTVILSFTTGDTLLLFCFGLKTLPGPLCYQSYLMIYLPKVRNYRTGSHYTLGQRKEYIHETKSLQDWLLSNWFERLPSSWCPSGQPV